MIETEIKDWYPAKREYDPGIKETQWEELVRDESIFTKNALTAFACLQDMQRATCSKLAKTYGRSPNFYNTNVWQTGKRIAERLNLPLMLRDNQNEKYWPVCCLGRYAADGYEYKIRPELEAAFNKTGILKGVEMDMMKENYNYYVISPNVWNDGEYYDLLDYMINNHCVLVGWNKDNQKGRMFFNLNPGDRIVVAKRQDWEFYYSFIGIVSQQPCDEYQGAQRRFLDNFIRIENTRNLLETWSYAKARQIPAIAKINKNRNPEIINIIESILQGENEMQQNYSIEEYTSLLTHTHNLIFHGAPGTGKTHLAKEIAKAMGAETAFVQFHPSYDYTDFVEGLRPVPQDDAGQIGFELRDGVFKTFCERALENLTDFEEVDSNNNFDEAWDKLLEIVRENIARGELTKIGIWEYSLSSTNSLKYQSEDSPSKYMFTITKKNVFDAYRNIQARPSGYFQKYMKEVADYMKANCGLIDYKKQEQPKKHNPFVFIIDEINRGDLSKIFGELFYALDPGYRVTAEALKAVKSGESFPTIRTQYANMERDGNTFDNALNISKQDDFGHFFVPENVYIIGTMNDIDRSVETMDFAFRRRFTFVEIQASDRVEMLEEITDDTIRQQALNKMNAINAVISETEGLSSAYHIGGAYFLKLKTLDNDFEKLWEYHLAPLIKEYLRGTEDESETFDKIKQAYDVPDKSFVSDSSQEAE